MSCSRAGMEFLAIWMIYESLMELWILVLKAYSGKIYFLNQHEKRELKVYFRRGRKPVL